MTGRYLLDAWAFLAFLQDEDPAASRVRALLAAGLEGGTILYASIINLGEVFYSIGRVRGEKEAHDTLVSLMRLPLEVIPASEDRVWAAARLKIHHRLSYADAFAVATAAEFDATLLSGDPEIVALAGHFTVEPLTRSL